MIDYSIQYIIQEIEICVFAFKVMENLRDFLANKCPSSMNMYGKILNYFQHKGLYTAGDNSRGFLQGGSGVLISNRAVRLFAQAMLKNRSFCVMINGRAEDQEISNCFRKLNIYPGESRDELNRERFLMDTFEQ